MRNHLHLIEYVACRKGILLEEYMNLQQNDSASFISLSRYTGLPPERGSSIMWKEHFCHILVRKR
jgi:hypothetical protein